MTCDNDRKSDRDGAVRTPGFGTSGPARPQFAYL